MPITPFHFGPAVFLGLLLFAFLDFPTFLVANVIVDLEPFVVLYFGLRYPLHGFFHSFVGGTIAAVLLAALMSRLGPFIGRMRKSFKLDQRPSRSRVLVASFLGVYSHVLLDAPLYPDISPFYPFSLNPLFSGDVSVSIVVYALCALSFLAGVVLYAVMLVAQVWKERGQSG